MARKPMGKKAVAKKPMAKKSLTKPQEAMMKKHSAMHTKKHMDAMRKDMLAGKTFKQAHMAATKKVGK